MSNAKMYKILLVAVAVAAVIFTGFLIYQKNRVSPADVLEDSFKKMSTVSSWTTSMESIKAPFQIKIDGNFHFNKDPAATDELSLISMQYFLDMPPEIPAQNMKIDFAFSKTDFFVGFSYSQLVTLLEKVKRFAPEIEKYKTYQLILPILRAEKWLHVAIPEGSLDEEVVYTKDDERITNSFKDALVYRKFDQNFQQDGKVFSRITIGLKKEKLLKALDGLKDSPEFDMKLSDFNKLVGIIKAIDSWNSDLIEFLVQKDDGMLRQIAFNLPELSKEELTILAELMAEGKSLPKDEIQNIEKIDNVFVIKFDNYNAAPAVAKIENFVEVDPILEAAKVELLPLVGQYLQAFGAK